MKQRKYQETHPWISFSFNPMTLGPGTLIKLGEALSKCDHVSGAPLPPSEADLLENIFLTKGIHATTSIEGNTLTEEEVEKRIDGKLTLPDSLEYQGAEIDNLLEILNEIANLSISQELPTLSITSGFFKTSPWEKTSHRANSAITALGWVEKSTSVHRRKIVHISWTGSSRSSPRSYKQTMPPGTNRYGLFDRLSPICISYGSIRLVTEMVVLLDLSNYISSSMPVFLSHPHTFFPTITTAHEDGITRH